MLLFSQSSTFSQSFPSLRKPLVQFLTLWISVVCFRTACKWKHTEHKHTIFWDSFIFVSITLVYYFVLLHSTTRCDYTTIWLSILYLIHFWSHLSHYLIKPFKIALVSQMKSNNSPNLSSGEPHSHCQPGWRHFILKTE